MTTFGQEMRELAQEMTKEFSEELGMSKIFHVIGSSYNSTSGQQHTLYSEHEAYATFTDITAKEELNESYRRDHRKCVIAGDDISIEPRIDDLIKDTDGNKHRVVKVGVDQYKAAYILHFKKKIIEDGT